MIRHDHDSHLEPSFWFCSCVWHTLWSTSGTCTFFSTAEIPLDPKVSLEAALSGVPAVRLPSVLYLVLSTNIKEPGMGPPPPAVSVSAVVRKVNEVQ